ncbi:hypothetical protein [Nonlabens marinus]|uniref:Uncharacterized protein n=1 Tax=Nonlabens marinus S1-08 TaxID=1454201 RepID=W8VUB6_9FLAO|nr:hypothetical protein [Nonlabens marinus]BAO54458.1 hypothetical protein NMS_0449 [Nonlabens marinus S1-08]
MEDNPKTEAFRRAQKKVVKLRNNHKKTRTFVGLMGALTIIMAIISIILLFKNKNLSFDKKYFNKDIKSQMEKAIEANAGLDVVKNIYNNRVVTSPSITDIFNKNSDQSKYPAETPLSEVLYDMKTDYYLNLEKIDTLYLKRLVFVIKTHELINPFDKLDQNQKNDFENLRLKLGINYSAVSADVNRITDQLHNKNQLVDKYLDKSNFSFLISIIALVLTIVLSLIQIFQNRRKRMLEIWKDVISNDEILEENKV